MTNAVERRFGKRTSSSIESRIRMLPASASPFPGAGGGHRTARGSSERLGGLDLLRLLAALAVVLFHFGYAGPTRGTATTAFPEIAGIAKYGYVGVDLFFLISGYVIMASATGRGWREFGWARLLRLYPGHVVCMSATALVLLALGPVGAPVTVKQWLANLTMFSPAFGQPFMDGAYWSIVIELVFYFWVGVLIALGLLERRLHVILWTWLAISFANEAFFQLKILRLGLATEYAGLFVSGIIIQRWRSGDKSPAALGLLAAAFCLGAFHVVEAQRVFERFYADHLDVTVQLALHAAAYALLIGGLYLSRWVPASRTVLMIGGLTYPLYLVHQNAGHRMIDTLAPLIGPWAALAVTLALALGFAWAVWRWAEPAGRQLMTATRSALGNIGPAARST